MKKIKKLPKAAIGFFLMIFRMRKFNPEKIFSGKRIAIVGPADSAYDELKGEYIDQFDYVIRINKAIVTWKPENEKFIGSKTDILIHSFHENDETGGGEFNIKLFDEKNIQFLVCPKNQYFYKRQIFNIYKKWLTKRHIYILEKKNYEKCEELFEDFKPTNGFRALHMCLTSKAKEIYITGITFYKTPYSDGYRDQLKDMTINLESMKKIGLHNPDLEYSLFLDLVKNSEGNVILDSRLRSIVENNN